MKNAGLCHENGQGTERNPEEGVRWYRRAADTGYMEAQCALGTCYVYGIGTPVNKALGKQWLQKAADQGYSEAKEKLRELQ
jgi:uncharacterized protein